MIIFVVVFSICFVKKYFEGHYQYVINLQLKLEPSILGARLKWGISTTIYNQQ